MGDLSRRSSLLRRSLALLLALLCGSEAGLLPAAAAVQSEPVRTKGFNALRDAATTAGWAPAAALANPPAATPVSAPLSSSGPGLPELLTKGVTAGRLRGAGRALIAEAPASRRAFVSNWVAGVLEDALNELADEAETPAAALARVRAGLGALRIAETPVLPASSSPAAVRAAQDEAAERIAHLGLPDFTPRSLAAASLPAAAPAAVLPPVPVPARLPALPEQLGQKQELAGGASGSDALSEFDRTAGRAETVLGPEAAPDDGTAGADDARDAGWAGLESLRRLFDAAGAPPDKPAPSGPPVPSDQQQAIEQRIANVERLKAELTADLASRDAAGAMLSVAARARDAALADRRSGKDDLEFRKSFSQLSMVMDLSYSLNILNSADAALANMEGLVAQKIQSITAQQGTDVSAGAAAGAQAGNTAAWVQQAQQAAAADQAQANSFGSLGLDVSQVGGAVSRFSADVPALLAMIDARDKGQSASAVAEYQRRLALLPSIVQQLQNGASTASSGVTSLSMAYLQSQSSEVSGDLALLSGADAQIAAAPVEFAGALVVAVPGVPSETVSNPTAAQLLALLSRRQAFWQSQYNQEASLLTSIEQALDPSNTAMTTDSFGGSQPVSLVYWMNQQQALDGQLAAAEAPMLAQATADEAVIQAAGGGASLPPLAGLSPDSLRTVLPQLVTQLGALSLPDSDAGYAAKAAYIDLSRLICFLGDATAQRLQAEGTVSALAGPVNVLLPKAKTAFQTAVNAWQAVLNDVAADTAYVNAGEPAAQNQALIDRKKALVDNRISPALKGLQDLLVNNLIPYQNTAIQQAQPTYTGDGYATLYTQKVSLYQQISDGLNQTLPWALASDGATPYSVAAAQAGIAGMRKTYDSYLATVATYQLQMSQRTDPNFTGTEVVYGETAPYSLVKRAAVYQTEKNTRVASMNADATQINALLGQMDSLSGGKTNLQATWKLPTNLDPTSPNTTATLNAMVSGNTLQNMAAAIQAVADAAAAAGGPPSVSVGGGASPPVGTQPPITISNDQKIALSGLEAITRLVPSSQSGPAGDSYAFCLARDLFADALVSSSLTYLNQRIPSIVAYLASAKAALAAAEADLDQDLAYVTGDRSNGTAVLSRKTALFSNLSGILNQGNALFTQVAGWDASGAASAVSAASYYNGLNSTYVAGSQALAAELQAAQEMQSALASSRAGIDAQRTEVVGWLQQLDNPNESALARVAENLSSIQDKTKTVLETNIQARSAQAASDKASAAVDSTLKQLAAERGALDQALGGVGDLARLGPDLSARAREAVGSGGAWIAEGPTASTLVIPRSQLDTFLATLLGGMSSGAASSNIASLSANILKDPSALANLIPGSKVIPVGQGPDGFYLVYQTEFSSPGGLETESAATLGNIAKIWGQNVSVEGYRFESPPSAGNAPYGDQGVTVQLESLDSDHAVNYLDITFHKFLQDIPNADGVVGEAEVARMMVFDDFALLLADGKLYFGATGFADVAAVDPAGNPQYYGGTMKQSVKFTSVLSLNASETALFANDPRRFLQTVNLDFAGYDPTLAQNFVISGSGDDKYYRRDQVGVGVDLGKALKEKDSFQLDVYYANVGGTDDVNQSLAGVSLMKGFTFDFMGQKAKVSVGGGGELGTVQDDVNGRVSFELPDQGIAISGQGKVIGTGSAYYAEVRKKLGDHSSAAISYGSQYVGLTNRLGVSFSSSYTLGELWRAVTGQAAADLSGGQALADFDKALAGFFTRSKSDPALAELKRVFDADVARQLASLEIGRLSREIAVLTKAGAFLDNTKQSAMVGFVSNAVGPGTAESATGGGFQVGTQTTLTMSKTQRALIESKTATLFSLGLDLEERLLDLTKAWQQAMADLAQARWRELLAKWLAAHADDPVLRAEAEADAAAAADARRQAELKYDALTGRGPDDIPPFDGVNPQDFDALLSAVGDSMATSDRAGALIQRARGSLNVPQAGFNVLDWIPWVEKLTFSVGAQLPDVLSSQALGVGLTITLPVYDPTRGRNDAAMLLQQKATMLEMGDRLAQTRLRAHGERLSAQAWAARAEDAAGLQDRLAAELSDGIRQFRNGLIQPSELRERARRWRDAVGETLEARTNASLEKAWAVLDERQDPSPAAAPGRPVPATIQDAFAQAAGDNGNYEAMARRSQAAQELLEASDRRVRSVDVDVTLGTNLTATGLALLPAFGITGLGAMPIVGVSLAPEELRQLDVARNGAEAGLYSRLKDKAEADAALELTRATIDAGWLDKQLALYRDELLPGLQAEQDGSAAKAVELANAQAAYADLQSRRRQTTAAENQLLGRSMDDAPTFVADSGQALAAFGGRALALDPVGAARDALVSRVKIAQAVEAAADKGLKVDQLRIEPISLIGTSLSRLVAALSGDAGGSPELMALAREQTLDAQRALEAFDAEVPAVRARLSDQLSAIESAEAALQGKTDAASRLQGLELGRQREQLLAQIMAWGGAAAEATNGSLPSSYADLEDRLRQAEEVATTPTTDGGDSGALSSPGTLEAQGNLRWYDARETLGGDPIGKQFAEGWVEARLRSPSTPPEALAMLARLRDDAADERRTLDMASADARAELLLSRLRLGAGLMRWSEGMGLGDSARARVAADLSEAAALLHLPPDVKPESLLDVMPEAGDGDLASVAARYLKEAESLDMDALSRTLFLNGLPPEFSTAAGTDSVPELRADLIASKMSSRGFTPLAAVGMFKGQWVSGAFLEAPDPDQIQSTLSDVLDDSLKRELQDRDRLKSLGLLLHALMSSVADKTRLVAAARLREILARRELGGTLERVRMNMAPASEGAAAAAEAQAAQEDFVSALYALREDFARLTTELAALGMKPGSAASAGGLAAEAPESDAPMERTPREKLLAYWADRMQDPDFERQVEDLLAGQPDSVRASLRDLSDRYRTAARDADAVRDNDFSPAERLELLTKTDLQGRRRAIEDVLSQVLDGLQAGDPAHSTAWAGLMDFLRKDVTAQAAASASDIARADETRGALRGIFAGALAAPPELQAEMTKLETLQGKVDEARRQALASWLARTESPEDHVLKDKALDAYVSALDAFDTEMAAALNTKSAVADAGWTRTLDALYDVRGSLERRRDRLEHGRGLLTIDAAITLDETRLLALRDSPTETREIDPASESLAYMRGLREKWTGHPDAIPALVELRGKDGASDWATVEDLAKAKLAGRVATIGGRRYLAPADMVGGTPTDAADALSRGWRQVIEGEDAARERLAQAREQRAAAANEAALTKTLESSEVALTAGPREGAAPTKTMTLSDLRGLEDAGRVLWFEGSADASTGLRAAVPAVAARWRDPGELTMLVLTAGEPPAPGRYPTLEALLASPDAARFARGRIGAAGLGALEREAKDEAVAARREGWLKLKLNAWGFALDAAGEVQAVYLSEDELKKASTAAADKKDPGHGWTYLRADAVALGLAADGTLVAVKAGDRTIALGEGVPARWVSQTPLAMETDSSGRVTRLFLDPKELNAAAAGWNLEDAAGRTWQGGDVLPPLLRARRWTDPASGLTVALGRDLLDARRDAAKNGAGAAARWSYAPAQWPGLITEIPRGIISTPIEIATGRDPNQQGYLGRANARRGEGGATVVRGALGTVLRSIDLFGLMNDPVDRYFDPSQYPDAVRRDKPELPGASEGSADMRTTDGKKDVFYGVGSFAREEKWAEQDLEASRDEVLAAFRGGVRRETTETVLGRAGDYTDSAVGLDVGRGAALAAIDELGSRLDAGGTARLTDSPRQAGVDRVDEVVQVVAGAQTQEARLAVYEAALKRLRAAPVPDAGETEVADAEASLSAALAARAAAGAAFTAASPVPNLPGFPVVPQLYASLPR